MFLKLLRISSSKLVFIMAVKCVVARIESLRILATVSNVGVTKVVFVGPYDLDKGSVY